MADNIIKVNVTASKPKSVTVSSSQVGTEITASSDTGKFWAQTAKNWAVSDFIVDNTDYSSKYYANKAKGEANSAKNFAEASANTYQNLQETSEEILNNLDVGAQEALDGINTSKDESIASIEAKANAEIKAFEQEIKESKEEIKDLIDNGKEELRDSIGDVKVLTTLEIGDIGIAPLGIDESKGLRRYLNGQVIIQDQYVQFTNKVKSAVALYPSLACTESEWKTTATMTVGGQVGKFVVDDNAGTIRLPKIIMPIQGLTDLSKLAEIVEAGLPNITGSISSYTNGTGNDPTGSGSLTTSKKGDGWQAGTSNRMGEYSLELDASLSSPTYGKSNTVQQEQIQYPYFIQVATGAETEDNIVNEIELNNPFSLLDYKYSEYELNNISWLRSNGQYNSKAIYPAVYDLLLKIYNGTETKAGVSVKLSTDTDITDYDFVLNTADETFRLPVKVKLASGKAVVGNGMTLGLTNGNVNFGPTINTNALLAPNTSIYGQEVGQSIQTSGATGSQTAIGVTTDPAKSGLELSDSSLYLYFYVGETVQNANLINAGRIEEKVADLIPNNSNLITNYCSPDYARGISVAYTSGISYTAPANGFFSVQLYYSGNTLQTLTVNNAIALRQRSGTSNAGTIIHGQILVGKGDYIVAPKPSNTGDDLNSAYFYPMKGAN